MKTVKDVTSTTEPETVSDLIKSAFPALSDASGGRDTLNTTAAAKSINRAPQTLRKWACTGTGPIQPVRIHSRLHWKVSDLRALLSGGGAVMNQDKLARANAQKNALKSLGLLKATSPVNKALADPKSLRKAVTAFCYECVGGDGEPGARIHVRNCTAPKCPLFQNRPWQKSNSALAGGANE